MNKLLILLLGFALVAATGCREENKKKVEAPKAPSEAEVQRLKSDSERLQQATANAAKEREKASQSATPSPSVSPAQP